MERDGLADRQNTPNSKTQADMFPFAAKLFN
jgi:hypothetical protein